MTDSIHDIIIKSKNGDIKAFEQLVKNHQQFCLTIAVRMLCDANDAQDVVQECFIRVWKNIHKFDANKKLTTWLYKIVTNLCYDRLKARARQNRVMHRMDANFNEPQDSADLENDFMVSEQVAQLQRLTERLSPKQKIVFTLRDLQDLSLQEISQITKMSVGSVKSNLCLARQTIKSMIHQQEKVS